MLKVRIPSSRAIILPVRTLGLVHACWDSAEITPVANERDVLIQDQLSLLTGLLLQLLSHLDRTIRVVVPAQHSTAQHTDCSQWWCEDRLHGGGGGAGYVFSQEDRNPSADELSALEPQW
jgi:hypothetical protein